MFCSREACSPQCPCSCLQGVETRPALRERTTGMFICAHVKFKLVVLTKRWKLCEDKTKGKSMGRFCVRGLSNWAGDDRAAVDICGELACQRWLPWKASLPGDSQPPAKTGVPSESRHRHPVGGSSCSPVTGAWRPFCGYLLLFLQADGDCWLLIKLAINK